MQKHPVMTVAAVLVALLVAYLLDVVRWKLKSDDELIAMAESADPRRVMVGLEQLRKRRRDISGYIHVVLPFLTAESAVDRVTAKMILQKHYPDDAALIKGYRGSDSLSRCEGSVRDLYTKYGVPQRS